MMCRKRTKAQRNSKSSKGPIASGSAASICFWFTKDANFPALVTTGATTDARPGALGQPNTVVMFGEGGQDYFNRSGARFFAGYWLDDEHRWGVEAGYFFIAGISVGQNFASAGSPVLARPFFNTSAGNDSEIIAYPGITNGNVMVTTGSFLQGVELNLTSTMYQSSDRRFRLEGLVGFRYLNLNESLNINEYDNVAVSRQYAGLGIPFAGDNIAITDSFTTRNDFYGAQLGGRAEFQYKRLSLELLGKVALGCSNEVVNIQGTTNITGQPTQPAGLLAIASNSGRTPAMPFPLFRKSAPIWAFN